MLVTTKVLVEPMDRPENTKLLFVPTLVITPVVILTNVEVLGFPGTHLSQMPPLACMVARETVFGIGGLSAATIPKHTNIKNVNCHRFIHTQRSGLEPHR